MMTNSVSMSFIMPAEPTREELMAQAFPDVKCPLKPFGNRILVQVRMPKTKTKSGLIMNSDTTDNLYRNEQTARVVSIGSSAFTFPSTGQPWPDGRLVE